MKNTKTLIDDFLQLDMDYSIRQKAFSPIYSYVNLVTDPSFPGIRELYLDYNRKSDQLWDGFLSFGADVKTYTAKPDRICHELSDGTVLKVAYYCENAFLVEAENASAMTCFQKPGKELGEHWILEKRAGQVLIQGYAINRDDRDPDLQAPILAGMRVLRGTLHVRKGKITVEPDKDGRILAAFHLSVLKISEKALKKTLQKAPDSADDAIAATRNWIREAAGSLPALDATEKEYHMLLVAVGSLIFNLAKAPGNLSGYISFFPSRGSYTTHFTWDSCFQNLAFEIMNPAIAKDSMLQLVSNMRHDGKIPQFLCSTWNRPHEVQPALIGWASLRLARQTNDLSFAKKILSALEINNEWWLSARMTHYGLIYCPHGLETGQDDSPRFDDGPVLAVDMNAYLVSQMRCCAELAKMLNLPGKAAKWEACADRLAARMVNLLYDPGRNLFFDVLAATGERRPLVTTSGLIPLWAGSPLDDATARNMIERWLLNPEHMFGPIPFPSVAYDEPVYDPPHWWRGPTWMPEAWLMLEVLERYGLTDAYKEGRKRLYEMMIRNGQFYELFNSQTGEGEGNPEQGWTAAIFIRMFCDIKSEK